MDKERIAHMIYLYICEGYTLGEIGKQYNYTSGDISSFLSPYKITGQDNDNGAYRRGKNCGKYSRSGYTIRHGENEGDEIDITESVILDYVKYRDPGQTLEDYLEYGNHKVSIKSPGRIAAVVAAGVILCNVPSVKDFFDFGQSSTYTSSQSTSTVKDDFTDEAKDIAKDTVKDKAQDALETGVQKIVSANKKASFFTEGRFDYGGLSYVGKVSKDKPYGICLGVGQYGHLIMGNFKKGELNGYGLRQDLYGFGIGQYKNGKQNGVSVKIMSTGYTIGKAKDGVYKGLAVQISKDGSVSLLNMKSNKSVEVARKIGSTWYKSNGKELKLKNNKYKGIELGDDTIVYGGATIKISSDKITYSTKKVSMSIALDGNSASYDTVLDGKKGRKLEIDLDTSSGSLTGVSYYKKYNGKEIETLKSSYSIGTRSPLSGATGD